MSDIDNDALDYHEFPKPGKLEISPTKPLATQNDLALAYSPGVAAACNAIVDDEANAARYTCRSNLVGVVTNGTAVLGLGNIGPLASKPVMEGKAVLFKKFSGIDVFDIEINQPDVDRFIDTVASLEPTFGGINLEDIKAPECFEVERRLRERMKIPVFHDDQHGTAIIVAAAVISALKVVNKEISEVRLVASGAGAAALACLNQLVSAGLKRDNVIVTDRTGVVFAGRQGEMDEWKAQWAIETPLRTLNEAIDGADIFLGLSGPGVLTGDMVRKMAAQPLIMALANPDPEILPEEIKKVRDDALICTGRSDYPNQVNNVLCFPYIFRGALDVGATTITEEMKLACVKALSDLVQQEVHDEVLAAYGGKADKFGPDYLIPKPFDPRLIIELSCAVARAAVESGVATRPIEDMGAYRQKLTDYIYRTGMFMRPVFEHARGSNKRLVYAEGEEVRVLQTVQQVVDNELAIPVLIGNPELIAQRIDELGLRLQHGKDFEIVDPQNNESYQQHWRLYHDIMGRKGITPGAAQYRVRNEPGVVAALMVRSGQADAMICGVLGGFRRNLDALMDIIGKANGIRSASTIVAHLLPARTLFISDAHVTPQPTEHELVETTRLAVQEVRGFGIEPKAALLSQSNFGGSKHVSAEIIRKAVKLLHEEHPEIEVDGEMHADAALVANIRARLLPDSKLVGTANLLVMPNGDAANIAVNLLKILGKGVTVGPILMGMDRSAHVVAQSCTVRNLVNMSAVAIEHALRMETSKEKEK